jgi:hypothetical protein
MKIMLCGRPGGCCPSVELHKEIIVEIRDDDHNIVVMTLEQFKLLQKINFDEKSKHDL